MAIRLPNALRTCTLLALVATLAACDAQLRPNSSFSIENFISSVTDQSGAVQAVLKRGAPPAPTTADSTKVSGIAVVINGGSSPQNITSPTSFTKIIIAAEGLSDYYELTLPAGQTTQSVLLGLSQNATAGQVYFTYAAGERMFVDFAGDKATYTDPDTGEAVAAEVFVAVLGASGMLYAEATRGQDLASWVGAHTRAWAFYGGVAEVTVPDNLRAGVTKACWYDPELNPSYAELARHFGTVVLPTRTAHPKDKAAVEAGVLSVERWVLAPLRNRRFFSLAELNAAIATQLSWLNGRVFRGEVTSRRELFEDMEAKALKPLPTEAFELAEWKKVTVNIDYHVEFDHRYYSVPYQLVRQRLDVRATPSTVEVLKGGKRVASHARERGRRRYVTNPDHMPASHRAHLEWTPSRLIEWAGTISGPTATLVERILATRAHPEHGYRASLGLMNLARRYGNERTGAACARALAVGAISYTSVKSILAEGLDRVPLPSASAPAPTPPEHENLRGPDYWAEEA